MTKKQVWSKSGIELVRKLSENGRYIFTTSEARELAPEVRLSSDYLIEALHHLAQTGWIVRLKQGVYAISSTSPGIPPLHEFAIAMALVSPAVISHWSAMHYYGFTEQIPNTIFVMTTERNHPRPQKNQERFTVLGQHYKFVYISAAHYFGFQTIWLTESKVLITNKERTLLDGLMMPRYCGNFSEVLNAFDVFIDQLNVDKLIEYALKLNVSTIKRLGWILDTFNLVPKSKLEILQSVPVNGYRLLNPTAGSSGKYNAKWKIQNNLSGGT